MKAQPMKWDGVRTWSPCDPREATHVFLHMPGPFPNRNIPVILKGTRKSTGCWSWNGDTEKPTIKPSILTRGKRDLTDAEIDEVRAGKVLDLPDIACHCWINDGKVQFLNDCTHEHAGKTLDLLDVER